nr:RPA-related protein RADX-like [Oncorhynchus nerka]
MGRISSAVPTATSVMSSAWWCSLAGLKESGARIACLRAELRGVGVYSIASDSSEGSPPSGLSFSDDSSCRSLGSGPVPEGALYPLARQSRERRKRILLVCDDLGKELLEYRWLRLDDGTSDQPIMIKLFSTSQPETHNKILPLSVVVCTRLQMVGDSSCCYLTNTTYTQIYCTGSGHHSVMPYRKLHPVRQFVRWLRSVDDRQVLSRAVVGGYFIYPPPAVSLEAYMKNRKGMTEFLVYPG